MKKVLISLLALFIFTAGIPFSVSAQTNCACYKKPKKTYVARKHRKVSNRTSNCRTVYTNNAYYEPRQRYASYSYKKPSFYRRHRNLINMGIATGGGTLIGALIGGKKGALIGAGAGAGAGAIYTYGLNKKKRRY